MAFRVVGLVRSEEWSKRQAYKYEWCSWNVGTAQNTHTHTPARSRTMHRMFDYVRSVCAHFEWIKFTSNCFISNAECLPYYIISDIRFVKHYFTFAT